MPAVPGTLERRTFLARLGSSSSPTEYEFELVSDPAQENAYLTIPIGPGPMAEPRYPKQDIWLTALFHLEPRIEKSWGSVWTLHGETAVRKAVTMILRTGRLARQDIEARSPGHPAKILAAHPKDVRTELITWVFKPLPGSAPDARFCRLAASMRYPGGSGSALCTCCAGKPKAGTTCAWFQEAAGAEAKPMEEVRLDPSGYENLLQAALKLPAALYESFSIRWEF
ncbi:MAG: hypothetical protein A2X36_09500 [Elusimicrobia bacterium GWA2_69_24]|nr:MAG: hypothetical protein A2X36_09500 [Elusimicrobia bacterium GWA2_69_24]